MESRQEETK